MSSARRFFVFFVFFVVQSVVHALPPTISFSVPSTVTVKGSQWEALPNGNGGWNQTYLSIGVHLSAQENVTATVEYASSNGTAVAGVTSAHQVKRSMSPASVAT